MTRTNPYGFLDRTVQKTHAWITDIVQHTGREDPHKAYQMLRAVLRVLRDRLTIDEAAHLGAQLPMLIRGIYYEGWKPSAQPRKIRTREQFVHAVSQQLSNNPEIDPRQAVEACFYVLNKHVTHGEIENIRDMLPETMRELLPA